MLRESLAAMFQRSLPEYLDGMITVVSVKMSPDLSIAKVYVSIYRSSTDPDLLVKRMNTHMPELRKKLTGLVSMKSIPELRFYRDDTFEAVERITQLLNSVSPASSSQSSLQEGDSQNQPDAPTPEAASPTP